MREIVDKIGGYKFLMCAALFLGGAGESLAAIPANAAWPAIIGGIIMAASAGFFCVTRYLTEKAYVNQETVTVAKTVEVTASGEKAIDKVKTAKETAVAGDKSE